MALDTLIHPSPLNLGLVINHILSINMYSFVYQIPFHTNWGEAIQDQILQESHPYFKSALSAFIERLSHLNVPRGPVAQKLLYHLQTHWTPHKRMNDFIRGELV